MNLPEEVMVNDREAAPASETANRRPRFQFSLGTMLLAMVIVGLGVALWMTNRRLAETERELEAMRPLSVEEVARQFEAKTTVGPISTEVREVRYSPERDAYRVEFSWTDAQTGKDWSTDLQLESDGFGRYFGVIHNNEFIKPLGNTHGYSVLIETPSGFEE